MDDEDSRETPVFSVSSLVDAAKGLLEEGFGRVAVEGEISNLARPRSGHVYFTLKDEDAQLRCALFKRDALRVHFPLADGLQVLARGRVTIYPARGSFQLIVSELEEAGLGALQRAFEALKRKLAEEGLFAAELKRPLPAYPRRIGVITSPTGAALRDILNVLNRRFPAAEVLIYPTPVQGETAAASIAAALERAAARGDCDVLILARGGGSLEDLWSFNEERVARAIRACAVPVVTGIGHETDFTIADFAADLRAPTPSAAAEAVVPDAAELGERLRGFRARMVHAWQRGQRERRQESAALAHRLALQHPRRRLQERAQRIDELSERLLAATPRLIAAHRARLATLRSELARCSPAARLERIRMEYIQLRSRLSNACTADLQQRRNTLQVLKGQLQALGPQQTLARGYAIVFDQRGQALRDAASVKVGDPIRARLAHGALSALVNDTEAPEK
ncbi:MAG: exodeoxyribonuclease VII large subunit [Gammaproteobacteria bacterium]|nr:exodeoxyribonuclease VII large subunit [Gammaproteobacteria bacterium]